MIDLYYWPTPNGHKTTIALEEMGLDYTIKPVNIGKGDQFDPAFLAFSPNNRMPAIIDHDTGGEPISVFESGAILLYLADKTGKLKKGQIIESINGVTLKDIDPREILGDIITAAEAKDGKINLSAKRLGKEGLDDSAQIILDALHRSGGELPLHDKSAPEEIERGLGMSKKAFKKALGGLYKSGEVELIEGAIRLID